MDDNRLTVLPFQMHTLDVLESFSMTGNDIKNPPLNYDKEGFPTLRGKPDEPIAFFGRPRTSRICTVRRGQQAV